MKSNQFFFKDELQLQDQGPTIDTLPKVYATTRPDGYPRQFVYNDHIYVFANKRKNDCRYVCMHGSNFHKGKRKCFAEISLPFPLPDGNVDDIQIRVLNSNHTCPHIENVVNNIINEAQIKQWVEEFYLSVSPRPTRATMIALVHKKIKEETKDGEEGQTVSETLINNFYTALEKEHKRKDKDFVVMLLTQRNTIFERFKYRFGNGSLMICYCSDFQERCIPQSNFLFIDGTFDTAPQEFKQVLVMMGQTAHMNVPISYILLPDKKQSTYEKAFILFRQEVDAAFRNGATFITDFEKAEFNAVKQILMDSSHRIQLCYFHFVQSMLRHFKDYIQDDLTSHLIDVCKMLPFISHQTLYDALDVMESYEELDIFVTYFKDTYINGYDVEDWSVYGKPSQNIITNNVAESHNSLLKRVIGGNPSLTQFEFSIKSIENDIYMKYNGRTYTQPTFSRYNDLHFKKAFRNMIDIIRKRRSIEQRRNGFADLYNQEDEYFTDLTTHEDNSINSLSILSDLNTDEEQQEEQPEEPRRNSREEPLEERREEPPEERLEERREEQQEEQNKAKKSSLKANIRQIPESAKNILIEKSKEFNTLKNRSDSRKQIVNETLALVSPIVPNISYGQIRSWFGNNKNKLDS